MSVTPRLAVWATVLVAYLAVAAPAATESPRERILELASMAPDLAGAAADLSISYDMEYPGSEGKAWVAEVRWTGSGGTPRVALVVIGHESLDPARGWLATSGDWGLARFEADRTWDDFIDGLRQSRIQLNEMATIGDLRAMISAQIVYSSVSGGGYGELSCMAAPRQCLPDYPADEAEFAPAELVAAERMGYRRSFVPGDGERTRLATWAVVAVPLEPGESGRRGFCADDTAVVCATPAGVEPTTEGGHCGPGCEPVE